MCMYAVQHTSTTAMCVFVIECAVDITQLDRIHRIYVFTKSTHVLTNIHKHHNFVHIYAFRYVHTYEWVHRKVSLKKPDK